MNLNDLNSQSRLTKPWLNIKANSVEIKTLEADIADIDDLVVTDLSANLLTLNNQVSVPNAPIDATSFWSSGSGNLSQTDNLGAVVTYATLPPSGSFVVGTAPSVVGHLASFNNLTADGISDSGIVASNVFLRNGSLAMTGDIQMGAHTITSSDGNVRLGSGVTAAGNDAVAIGTGANAFATGAVSIGQSSFCGDGTSVALGSLATANGNDQVVIGVSASADGGSGDSVVVGYGASCTSTQSVVIGAAASANAGGNCVLGRNSVAGNVFNSLMGFNNSGFASNCMLGHDNSSSNNNNIVIGNSNTVSANDAHIIGDSQTNSTANSLLIANGSMVNIRSDPTCSLGTSANPFLAAWLRDSQPAVGCKFSMYDPVTLTNTVTETQLLTGSSVGNLTYSNNQALGSVMRFKLNMSLSVAATDTLTLRFKVNSITVASVVTGGSIVSSLAENLLAEFVVRSASLASALQITADASPISLTNGSAAYNPTFSNIWSITGQWSGADPGNILVVNYANLESLFAV